MAVCVCVELFCGFKIILCTFTDFEFVGFFLFYSSFVEDLRRIQVRM